MQQRKVDIAIVGAGLIGSALALWLAKHTKYSIALIERHAAMPEPAEENQRVVALGQLATDFLSDIGVFQTLGERQCHAYHRMCVWDENSDGELNFDAKFQNDTGKSRQNQEAKQPLGYMTDSLYCNYACQQAAISDARIDTCFDTHLVSIECRGERTRVLSQEYEFSANLLVAADGSNSWVRRMSKIFANHQDYKQRGIVCRISTELSHEDCAWQRFLETGPLAILPLDGNQSSIVWSAENRFADELMALNTVDFESRLELALQGRLGKVTALSERLAFPLRSLRADTYYKRGLVLVGDAAHSIHPLAGQGANLGFKDIQCLGQLIAGTEHSNQLSRPRLLSRFQTKRQIDNNQTDALMSALHHAYQVNWPLWMAARGFGMNVLNRSELIRRLFIVSVR